MMFTLDKMMFRSKCYDPITALVGGGLGLLGSVAGGLISSSGQQSAAATEAAASNNATQVQWNEFLQQQANQQPWLQAGTAAENALASRMGLSTSYADPSYTQQPDGTYKNAAGQTSATQPMLGSTGLAANDPNNFMNVPGMPKYDMTAFQNDPLYQVMMNQQNNILAGNRAGAAGGGSLGSGNQMAALQSLAGQNAENYYQQGYNNNLTGYNAELNQQNTEYNRLASLSGVGQTAANTVGQAGQNAANNVATIGTNAANNIASTQIGSANAIAGGITGATNSLTSGLNNYTNYNQQQQLLNLLGSSGGSSSPVYINGEYH